MKKCFATVGPAIPLVPVSDFSKRTLSRQELVHLWEICGPSAAYNLERNPLWIAVTMAYFEGLMHGAGLEAERHMIHNEQIKESVWSDCN